MLYYLKHVGVVLFTILAFAAAAADKPPLSNAQALSMLSALRNLDGHVVVIKQNGTDTQVMVPWEFASGTLRLRIARNITALTAVEKSIDDARQAIVKEILKGMPPDKDGKPATTIAPGSPEFEQFQRQITDALNAGAAVDLNRIKASELKLEKNEIPGTAISALSPIIDDDVSPK